jgi:8-oxo-dGTP pyrophosphatase MutT (NUDIX family)
MKEKLNKKQQYRKGVFVVVYRINSAEKPEYLLLKRKLHWKGWEFPKGGVEKKETLFAAAKRECFEECGLKPLKIKKYNISGKYNYHKFLVDRPNFIGQTYSLFSAQVDNVSDKEIRVDKREHSGFKWIFYEKAITRLSWPNQKKCLRIVNRGLK